MQPDPTNAWLILPWLLAGCRNKPTPAPAQVKVTFDQAGGGSGFSDSVYAQEITLRRTARARTYPTRSGQRTVHKINGE